MYTETVVIVPVPGNYRTGIQDIARLVLVITVLATVHDASEDCDYSSWQ